MIRLTKDEWTARADAYERCAKYMAKQKPHDIPTAGQWPEVVALLKAEAATCRKRVTQKRHLNEDRFEVTLSYHIDLHKPMAAFCFKHGYVSGGHGSAKLFFDDLTSGQWVRLPIASYPVPKPSKYDAYVQRNIRVSNRAHKVLAQRGTLYKTFGHMVQDIIAGNWVRRENINTNIKAA